MAKPEETKIETWGTKEELLLVCAVNRYGTKNWDSIAMEIQNRSSSPHLLTSENCKQKYYDLQRRFMAKSVKINEDEEDESETDHMKEKMILLLDELRKLRVAELRREVERYDVSIVSLELKLERLREERERSLNDEENNEEKPDLRKDKSAGEEEPVKSLPENVFVNPVHENQSFNESNSTDLKGNNRTTGEQETEKKPDPVEPVSVQPDPVPGELASDKPIGEGSYNGSSDTIAKETKVPAVKKSSVAVISRKARDSPDLFDSVVKPEDGAKESSDVQSSASLSRKKSRKKFESSSGDEPETDEVFPANDRICKRSEPLMHFLEIIYSHKYGSVFERRLKSQETDKYRSVIREHVDLKTVKTRLKQGRYTGCRGKFLRDLLLLFNNAIIFFPKDSSEYVAAIELRQLVKKIKSRIRNSNPPLPPTVRPTSKRDPESSDSVLLKPKPTAVPTIACRKRSSIERKTDKKAAAATAAAVTEEKPVQDRKKPEVSSSADIFEDRIEAKKRKRDRSASATRSSKTSGVNRINPDDNPKMKTDQKKSSTIGMAKKQSAANFLSRIKRNSSTTGGTILVETLKKSSVNNLNSRNGGGDGTKKTKNMGKGDGRRDQNQIFRRKSSVKETVEQSSPTKRNVGRPPKRGTATPASDLDVVGSRQQRKRTRK